MSETGAMSQEGGGDGPMVKVAKKAKNGSRVIKTVDGWEAEAV